MKVQRKVAVIVAGPLAVAAIAVPASTVAARPTNAQNIVQVLAAKHRFSTLVALVKKAGLVGALEKPGPYTVFAPTNGAFKACQKHHPKLYKKVAQHKKLLKDVLLYHVAKGKLLAQHIVKLHRVKTLLGQYVKVHVRHGKVFINQAKVIKANIKASNGVIHAINAVLVPKLG